MAVVRFSLPGLLAAILAACGSGAAIAPSTTSAAVAREGEIAGYGGITMEPFVSRDGRFPLWFTRLASASGRDSPQIWRAHRAAEGAAFDAPVRIDGLGDFVEAPALSADERLLYFHRKVGT